MMDYVIPPLPCAIMAVPSPKDLLADPHRRLSDLC